MSHYAQSLVLEANLTAVLCSSLWRHHLRSLEQFVATGRGTPHEVAAAVAN